MSTDKRVEENAPFNFVIQEVRMQAGDKVKLIRLMNKALTQHHQEMMSEVEKSRKQGYEEGHADALRTLPIYVTNNKPLQNLSK